MSDKRHDIRCPFCNAEPMLVECDAGWCFCNYCAKSFLKRDVRPKKRPEPKTDLGGVLMDED